MLWRRSPTPRFIEYQVPSKNMTLSVAFFESEVWLSQKQLSEILGVRIATINEHLKKIFNLDAFPATKYVRSFPLRAEDGKTYAVKHYRTEILEEIQRRSRR